jgi:hypothetical protein
MHSTKRQRRHSLSSRRLIDRLGFLPPLVSAGPARDIARHQDTHQKKNGRAAGETHSFQQALGKVAGPRRVVVSVVWSNTDEREPAGGAMRWGGDPERAALGVQVVGREGRHSATGMLIAGGHSVVRAGWSWKS